MNTLFRTITVEPDTPARKPANINLGPDENQPAEKNVPDASPDQGRHEKYDKVFIRDLELEMLIGVHQHEKRKKQRVVLQIELCVSRRPAEEIGRSNIEDVVCYEKIIARIRALCGAGHVELVEILAEDAARACLEDPRVCRVALSVEKPEAFAGTCSVGVSIVRSKRSTSR